MRYIPYNEEDELKPKRFIPKFFEFNPKVFGNDIMILTDRSGECNIYMKPIVRTILNEKTLLSKIKERTNSNARLLIKKGMDNSKIVTIKSCQWIKVNCEFEKVSDTKVLVYNKK
jgi:hypothetical protein